MEIESGLDEEQFRFYGKQLVDWIADYLKEGEKYPVFSQVSPGEIRKRLPSVPPQKSEQMDEIFSDFERVVLPGITHWNKPGFMAYFAISGSAPGILAELVIAALNVNGMLWRTSPAATELEELVIDWFRQMLGLPIEFDGVITDTASVSTLIALTAARDALNGRIRSEGLSGENVSKPLRLYCSEQAHSSVEKAGIVLGIGQKGVKKISVDSDFQMNVKELERTLREDAALGYLPFCVVATVGTTSTTSIDPVSQIAEICEKNNLWLHIDGAYGGTAAIVPEMRYVLNGCERADSIVVNPHKWMFTPIDCSVLFSRRMDILNRAFSLVPEYLKTPEGDVKNFMDYGIQLGRRFRGLKLWFVIRSFGVEGLRVNIREHCRLAKEFAQWIDNDSQFERLAPVPFSVVCFRYHPSGIDDEQILEAINEKLIQRVNATGEIFISHTKLNGKFTIRVAIGHLRTT